MLQSTPQLNFEIKDEDQVVKQDQNSLTLRNINSFTGKPNKLSDVINFLPPGIIYKAETGMGATTLELFCNRNSIIVEPLRTTAYAKAKDPKNPYPAMFIGTELNSKKGTPPEKIKKYLLKTLTFKKFLVVADSLPKLMKEIPVGEWENYHLLIDESDSFQLESTFRDSMEKCLDIYKKFLSANRSMVTATPLKFSDPGLTKEPMKTFLYQTAQKRHLELIETDNGLSLIAEKIRGHFSVPSDQFTKLVVAINSISDIMAVIEAVSGEGAKDIPGSQITVLCSSSRKKEIRDYYAELTDGRLKSLLTFMTSAYFTGFDIYDKYDLITLVSSKKSVLMLSEKKLKQVAGRGRNGLLSETIVYDQTRSVKTENFTFQELEDAARAQAQSLNCIEHSYRSSSLMKNRMKKTLETLMQNGSVDSSRLVRRGSPGEYLVSYLNIDAQLEHSRVNHELYQPKDGLLSALNSSGCIVTRTQMSSAGVVHESSLIKGLAKEEVQNLREMLDQVVEGKKSINELLEEQELSDVEKSGLHLYEEFKKRIETKALREMIMKTVSPARSSNSVKNLSRLKNILSRAVEDPEKGFLREMFLRIPPPASTEKGKWYSKQNIINNYKNAALNSNMNMVMTGQISDAGILNDFKAIYETRSSKKKAGEGFIVQGRKLVEGVKGFTTTMFSANDYDPDDL
ncbi:MAG: hypothetical protein Q8S14_14915 [Algoriphagus sp.]|uniref:hypothetical protein n=1 Tax=Algoriphagus sp. TaxID=1872435 RepID=UPI00273147BC|nr:hypothetical protein [Algoriphagus sp.]MDP2041838.1 hypothetical protein [Algoriphagus sp.]MDP3473158.1 hypothetical protein [Algoriphagus sp.]